MRGARRRTTRPTTRRVPYAREVRARDEPRLVPTLNTYGRGPARRDPLRHRPRHGAASSSSRWPTAATTRSRSTSSPAWSSAAWSSPRRRATCTAASRSAGPSLKAIAVAAGRRSACYWFARVGTHDATNSFKAYRPTFVREVGIESDAGLRGRHRAGGQGPAAAAAGRRDPDDLARPHASASSNFKLAAWLPRVPALVLLRVRARSSPLDRAPRRPHREGDSHEHGPRHRLGRLHRRLRRRGAARPRPRGRRHRQPLEVRPGRQELRRPPAATGSSRATPATST